MNIHLISISITICIGIFNIPNSGAFGEQGDGSCVVNTKNGQVSGKLIPFSSTQNEVCGFFGIPFAKPPIGDLRFKRPIPFGNWNGILDGTRKSNACPQKAGSPSGPWALNATISEDCLYLNIWVPLSILENQNEGSAAVMIWIYGGALQTGSITMELYNGAVLAATQDVIVASMNYRLGPFGFLYFGTAEAPGNVGLLDQHLAIKWINSNIQHFGGNPDEVTLFGESAGSISASYQLLSPLSQGLFKRAILMSGVGTASVGHKGNKLTLELAYEIAEGVGCYSSNKFKSSAYSKQRILRCLKKLKWEEIVDFGKRYEPKEFLDNDSGVVVDGYFINDTPNNLLNNGGGVKADLIIGDVGTEGSLFMMYEYPKLFNPESEPVGITYEIFQTTIRNMFKERAKFEIDAILEKYTNWENLNDSDKNAQNLVELAGDYSFVCPDVEFGKKWADRTHNVFFYMFNQPVPSNSAWVGTKHSDEVEYIFGAPLEDATRAKAEQELSLRVMRLFSNFAKNGIPSEHWDTYTSTRPVFLDLNATIISEKPAPNIFGPHADACYFWNVQLPRLRKLNQCQSNTPRPRPRPHWWRI